MRAVDYERVSTDEQAREGYSLGSQKEKNIKFIESQNWELIDSYEDDGYSAKDLKRPSMQRLIKDAKAGKFDVVVFYKLDRLVRSVSDLDALLKTFDAHNIGIRSVTEPFDTTTAMGRFLITLVAAIAQWERETISERVVINMASKAEKGERNGGRAPFGYSLKEGKLTINDEEAPIIREMFRLYIAGKGLRTVAIFLQQYGVKKDIRTISRWIENPVYAGLTRWANNSKMDTIISEAPTHEAIIDMATFEQAQQLRTKRAIDGKKATSPYHFSGVLRCARCGGALSGFYKKAKDTKHYICINKKNKGTCDLPIFLESKLTDTFLKEVSADDPVQFLRRAKNFSIEPKENDNKHLRKELERELAAIKTRKRNWMLALGNGIMKQEDFLEMTAEDNKREAIIKEQLAEMTQEEVTVDFNSVLAALTYIPELWKTANDSEKKGFINHLFSSMTVDVPSTYQRSPGNTPAVVIADVEFR